MNATATGAPAAAAAGAALLGAWELYVDLGRAERTLPAPHAIAGALWNNAGLLATTFAVTAEEVALGVALALPSASCSRSRSISRRRCAERSTRWPSARRRSRSP